MSETHLTASTELGELPADWRVQRFDTIFAVQQGKQVSKKTRIGENQRPFLRTKNVAWGRLELSDLDQMNFTPEEEKRLALESGDLLVCEGGDIGRTGLWKGELARCYYQNHLHRARLRDAGAADPRFALYWLWYAFEVGSVYFGRGNVTTIPNLSQSKLCELPLPVPPLLEQRRIAAVLGLVQHTIQKQERLLTLTGELKKTLLQQLFGRGIHGEPQKETEIGPLPKSWELRRFGDLAVFKNGINFTSEQKGDKGILTVDVLNMYGDGSTVILENVYRVNKQIQEDYWLRDGDLLFVRSSVKQEGVGWTCTFRSVNEPVTYCGFIIRARLVNPSMTRPQFLTHYFRTDKARRTLVSGGARVAITNINQGLLQDILVPVTSVEEQDEIANAVDQIDLKLALHRAKKTKLEELFRTLLHQLMTAQIRAQDLDLPQLETAVAE